ncbi:MAG: phage holin family protein [Candidatus Pacebacteria bacterium]|nr:phage holin family protein [Candidatus Paceibacterota bacterium]
MTIIAKWFISALSLLAADHFIDGISIDGLYIALIVALLLGLLNAVVRPLLVVLTLPVTVVTLGLFIFVINGFLFWFLSTFIQGFEVDGIWAGMLGAVLVSIFSWIGNKFIVSENNKNTYTQIHHG